MMAKSIKNSWVTLSNDPVLIIASNPIVKIWFHKTAVQDIPIISAKIGEAIWNVVLH